MQFLDALNPEQREAVLHIRGPLLILAGAGSGKTRVITSRIAYLVGDGHAEPHEVLAVTFTNKAAEEMRARVEALLGSECSGMWRSTFHSLWVRPLRGGAAATGPARVFVLCDLLLKTVDLFEQSEPVRAKYEEQFRFVMVDEYQDTNRPQYLLIRRLAEVHRNLCVVGDPDQSIYKWRGADLRNILDFENDFPEATIVKLERNYRSTQIILDAATAVITQNRNRKDKRLWTDRKGGDRIVYFRGGDELEEADFITRTARTALADDVDATVAVLYRTNAQSRTIEDALMREGISYKIVGGVRFYERKEIKDALAYMRLVINPHDDVSLRRVINVPARGIGKGVMDAVEAFDSLVLRQARGERDNDSL